MDEYISREALLAEIAVDHGNWISYNDTDELYRQGVEDNYSDIRTLVKAMPAADVQPVKHACWLGVGKKFSEDWTCSNCMRAKGKDSSTNFCSYCGADMQGDTNG